MKNKKAEITISESEIADLAIECWRMKQWVTSHEGKQKLGALRRSCQKMEQFLAACRVEFVDLLGREYDAGMSVEVIDSITADDDTRAIMIVECISPLVLRNDVVIRHGKIVTQVPRNPPGNDNLPTCPP